MTPTRNSTSEPSEPSHKIVSQSQYQFSPIIPIYNDVPNFLGPNIYMISTWYLLNIYVISTWYLHDPNTDVDLTVAGQSCDVRSGGGGPHPLHQVISIISTLSTISSVSISTISAQHGHLLHVGAVRVVGPAAVQQTGRSALRDALTLTQESRR